MRRLFAYLSVALLAAVMTACGNGDGNGTSSAEARNDEDVTFVQAMIPHHRQALEMAEVAETRAASPQVKDLARRIKGAQQPEIDRMEAWLQEWAVASTTTTSAGGHGGHGGGAGMMAGTEMASLAAATGQAFDRRFLELMIEHHRGAVDVAEKEIRDGKHPAVKELAGQIASSQQAEIEEMRTLLGAQA